MNAAEASRAYKTAEESADGERLCYQHMAGLEEKTHCGARLISSGHA
jgi:hypothetical protein